VVWLPFFEGGDETRKERTGAEDDGGVNEGCCRCEETVAPVEVEALDVRSVGREFDSVEAAPLGNISSGAVTADDDNDDADKGSFDT